MWTDGAKNLFYILKDFTRKPPTLAFSDADKNLFRVHGCVKECLASRIDAKNAKSKMVEV